MARELHVLDGLDLADGVVFDLIEPPVFTPAPVRLDWVGGVDSDGSVPLDAGHSDNCTLTLTLRVQKQTTADLAWTKVGLLVAKLESSRKSRDGLQHLWTPKDSSSTWILTVLSAEIVGVPMDSRGDAIGYLLYSPRFTVVLTCAPFLYRNGELITTFTDAFTTDSSANYTYDEGSGLTISGGKLNVASTGVKRWVRSTYQFSNVWATLKHTPGAINASQYKAGFVLKRIDANNYIEATIYDAAGPNSYLVLNVITANVSSSKIFSGTVTPRLAAATSYWFRTRIEGNVITLEHWTAAPTDTTSPAITSSFTLTGADATNFGVGITAGVGLYLQGNGTAGTVDDFTIEPNAIRSTEPVFSIDLPDVPGHVDAEATVTVIDAATQSRRHVEWGLGDYSTAPLLIDSASLVTSGFAGTATTRSGAYSGNGVVRASLATQSQAVCGTGNLAHVGVHRVKARIYISTLEVHVRLAYRTADGPYSYTPWFIPAVSGAFCEVSFGVVTIGTVTVGAQQWDGRIEAYSTIAAPLIDTIDVDYLEVLPANRWARARGAYQYQTGLLVAHDEFASRTAGAAITAAAAPLGGSWVSSASTSATDFAAADAPGTLETMTRATISDAEATPSQGGRRAILGSTSYTDIEVGVDFYYTGGTIAEQGVLVRYVDATNFLRVTCTGYGAVSYIGLVGGSGQVSGSWLLDALTPATWYSIRAIVFASGRGIVSVFDSADAELVSLSFVSTVLATGGALATGKPGLIDQNRVATAATRYYRNFYAATPPAEPIAIYSTRSIQFRSNATERASSDGLTYGKPKLLTGGGALVPCGGDSGRVSRLWTKARRNDVEVNADTDIADATKLSVTLRPRYRFPTLP